MITEYLMKPGAFAFRLDPATSYNTLAAVREFDHLVVTPTWLDPTAVSDLTMLANAIYSGPITGKPTPYSFEGASWNWWLGTDDGLGAIYETPVANSTAATLSTWIGQLRPNSVGAGSVTDTGTNLAYSYQWVTPREAIDHLCRCVGAEWRVNPTSTLDAAAPATLHANYTTPKVVFANKPEGREGAYVGFNVVSSNKSRDINGYATRVVVAGKAGDGAVVASGAARLWAVYCEAWAASPIEGRCVLANRVAAQRSGLSLATVKRRLREWREWGWVLRETRVRTVRGLDGRWRTCERRGHPRAWQASSFTARLLTPPAVDAWHRGDDCRSCRTTTREDANVGHGLGGRESSGGRSSGSCARADGGVVVGSGSGAVRRVRRAGRGRGGVQPHAQARAVPDLRRAGGDRGGSVEAAAGGAREGWTMRRLLLVVVLVLFSVSISP
jgi:hypothetical protein